MDEERFGFFNLRAMRRPHLFEVARSLNGAVGEGAVELCGPAVVMAQAAVELAVEAAIDAALQLRDVHDPLREWFGSWVSPWSPKSDRVQDLWMALTGDKISDAPGWAAYAEGLKLRHDFVHRARAVSREQAESFITAAEEVVGHVMEVMAREFPPPPGTYFGR